MKIIADRAIPFATHLFSNIGDVSTYDGRAISSAEVMDADALIVRTVTRVDEQLLAGSRIRFVGTATSGHDHVDIDYLQRSNISFAHAPGCNARSVAEYVLSSLFVLAEQRNMDLTGITVGIVGCGRAGMALFRFLDSLGIRCLLNDPPLQQSGSPLPLVALDDVLKADVITLHVPLNSSGSYPTRHLLGREHFSRLRKDAIIINAARGGVIDEQALEDFIDAAPDSAVALDVWEGEPAINPDLLRKVTLSTPHIAGYSLDAKLAGTLIVYRQACRFLGVPVNESAIPVLPGPQLNHLRISDYDKPLDAIQLAVLASYDVRTDSAALRHLLSLDPEARDSYFSGLRNNYPLRREFGSLTVALAGQFAPVRDQLSKLGFNVE